MLIQFMDKKSAFFIILSIIILAVMLYFMSIDNIIVSLKNANLAIIAFEVLLQIFTYFLLSSQMENRKQLCRYNCQTQMSSFDCYGWA